MNEDELKRNSVLTEWVVKDLNEGTSSMAYLVQPSATRAEPLEQEQPQSQCLLMPAMPLELAPSAMECAGCVSRESLLSRHASHTFADPKLPYEDNSFDVITNAVSVDYLAKPMEVFKEMHRVLKPGGQAIMSFSNRCFPTKGAPPSPELCTWQRRTGMGTACNAA